MPLPDNILQPIPGDNPGGADLRYQPIYDQIKEARREEDDVAQGVWQRARKVADWAQVVKLAANAIAKQSKDLQLAAWLTEALVYREGFTGLREGLQLTYDLLDQFWDHLYPELEDDDSEMRSVPLAYVVNKVDIALRKTPLTAQGVDWYEYKDSLTLPTEEDASRDTAKSRLRSEAESGGKVLPEEVDSALKQTPSEFFDELEEELRASNATLDELDALCTEKFGEYAPGYGPLKECIEQIENTVRIMRQRRDGLMGGGGAKASGAAKKEKPAPAASSGVFGDDPFAEEPAAEPEPAPAASSDPFADDPFADESPAAAAEPATSSSSNLFEDDPFAEPQPAAAGGAPARAASGATLSAEPVSPEDAVARIAGAALWLRTQAPTNPGPYLLLRALRWGELRAGGPQLDWALLESPPSELRQRLKRLAAESEWEQVLAACEEAMSLPCGRAWLEPHRYEFEALTALGEEYAPLQEALRRELSQILSEYPDLPGQTLTDDTPAANAQTLAFLRDEGMLDGTPRKAAEPVRRAPTQEEMLEEAVKSGKYEIALALVARAMQQETSGRGRFERKVLQARLLMEAGRRAVAYPILRELATEIFERRLDEWESAALVVEPLMLLYRCLDGESDEAGERQKIYELICRLDPVRAFELH
ncbi:MAG: type VI secretion system protein TssA [Bryobacteraceae bacterium]|nr:type VI secretion system protein TssA [Bryobacteraceae bacterium]